MYKTIKAIALVGLLGLTGCMRIVGVHVRTDPLYCGSVGYTLVPREYHYVPIRSVYILPRPTLDLRVGLTTHRPVISKPRYTPVHRPRVNEPKRPQRMQRPQRTQKPKQLSPQRPVQQNRPRQPFPQLRR